MNTKDFLNELSELTGFDMDKCININKVFEDYEIISKDNKDNIIKDLREKVCLKENESVRVYEIALGIINSINE